MSLKDSSPISRRAWLGTTSGVIAVGLLKTQADAFRLEAQETPVSGTDPTKVPGRIVSGVGERAPAEQPRRLFRSQELSSSSRSPPARLLWDDHPRRICTSSGITLVFRTSSPRSTSCWCTAWSIVRWFSR